MSLERIIMVGDPAAMRTLATTLGARAADIAETVSALRRTSADLVFEGPAGDRFFSRLHETMSTGRAIAAELDHLATSLLRDAGSVEHTNLELQQAAEDSAAQAAEASVAQATAAAPPGPAAPGTAGAPAPPGPPPPPAGEPRP